ncbi:MAG TPA: CBS domain-containing protein [Anaerolineae bacterium]|nr:CBS domain-containing protein [Anaerolineae bacterium]
MNIGNILATKGSRVITIHPEQSLKEAIALLTQHQIGALVVVDKAGKPVGILTERDIVHAADRSGEAMLKHAVKDVMTKNVVIATPHDELQSVLKTMSDRRFRHMPVMDEGQLAGIISIGDVVKAQLDEYRGAIDTLQSQL